MRFLHRFALAAALGCSSPAVAPKGRAGSSGTPSSSLYSRLGGSSAIQRLVDQWILEAATDPRIRQHFVQAPIATLKLRLVEYLCVRSKGPCLYKGRDLVEAHAALRLKEGDLAAFLEAFTRAAEGVDLDPAIVEELREELGDVAGDLLAE